MKRVCLLVPLALIAVPAQAGPLVADAGLARYALAADQGAFLDWLDPASRSVFAEAMGGDHGELGRYWEILMAGAVQARREDGEAGETLWFNPLLDAGLAARWELRGEQWIATQVRPVAGEELRGAPLNFAPVEYAAGIRAEAEARARETWQAARTADWFPLQAGSGTAALSRAVAARASLDAMRASAGHENAVLLARAALVTGDERLLPDDVRTALALTGPDARLSLRPIAAYRRPDGWTLALQSPDAPMLAWLVHFEPPANAASEASILGYQLLNLGDAR